MQINDTRHLSLPLAIDGTCYPLLNRFPVRPDSLYQLTLYLHLDPPTGTYGLLFTDADSQQVLPHTVTEALAPEPIHTLLRTTCSTRRLSVCVSASGLMRHSPLELQWLSGTAEAGPAIAQLVPLFINASVVVTMATLPDRAAAAVEAVMSVYPFVDAVRVFVANRKQVPRVLAALDRVSFAFADETDNLGDGGKFFWAAEDAAQFAYHLTIDDDILYPPDYAQRMVATIEQHGDRVLAGVHCVTVKQPLRRYYAWESKYTHHFHWPLVTPFAAHVIGTGTLAYATRTFNVSLDDIRHRNMADMWIALRALRLGLPRVCVPRPAHWLAPQNIESVSIFTASNDQVDSSTYFMGTGAVQDFTIKREWPMTAHVPPDMLKFVWVLFCGTDAGLVQDAINSFNATAATSGVTWVAVMLVSSDNKDVVQYLLRQLVLPEVEVHVIYNRGTVDEPCQAFNRVVQLLQRIGFDFAFVSADAVRFKAPGWAWTYWSANRQYNMSHFTLVTDGTACAQVQPGMCHAAIEAVRVSSFFTFAPQMVLACGLCDTRLPLDQQFTQLARRWGRLHGAAAQIVDIMGSDAFIELRDDVPRSLVLDVSGPALAAGVPIAVREADLRLEPLAVYATSGLTRAWGLFERSFVMSGNSAPWREIEEHLIALGLVPSRYVVQEQKILQLLLARQSDTVRTLSTQPDVVLPSARAPRRSSEMSSDRDFCLDTATEASRRMYWEASKSGNMTTEQLADVGAWIGILQKAMKRTLSALLVLEDTVLISRDFRKTMDVVGKVVPPDWDIIYLGGNIMHSQGTKGTSPTLTRVIGCMQGAFAVIVRDSVYADLLHHLSRADMPVDVGALSAVCRQPARHCYAVVPPLFVMPNTPGWDAQDYARRA